MPESIIFITGWAHCLFMIMWKGKVWLSVDNRQKDLCVYRLSQAEDSIKVAKML